MPRSLSKVVLVILLLIPFFGVVKAEEQNFGVVSEVSVSGDGKEGDIVVNNGKELAVSTNPYQNVMIGVIAPKPEFSVKSKEAPANATTANASKVNVITSGVVMVNVTTKNGDIKKGDWITSSDIKGAGMKALRSGYVLGSALEDYSNGNKEEVKKIGVALNVHHMNTGTSIKTKVGDIIRLAALAAYENPKIALKYVTAVVISLGTILISFLAFGKISRLGIIALGRNPLASKKIYKGILINAGSSLGLIIGGLTIAYFVLRMS